MMNKKILAGVAFIATAGAVALPAVNGMILEGRLRNHLQELASNNDYAIETLDIQRGFSATELAINLQGTGLRKVNGQSVEVSGTLDHASLFSLFELMSGELDIHYYSYEQGVRFSLPTKVSGSMTLNGSFTGHFSTEGLELPLDPGPVLTMQVEPASGIVTAPGSGKPVTVDIDPVAWTVLEKNQPVSQFEISNARMEVLATEPQWQVHVPQLVYSIPADDTAVVMRVSDVQAYGQQQTDGQNISSRVSFSTGSVDIPVLENTGLEGLIKGLTITSSVENLDRNLLERIPELIGRIGVEPMSGEESAAWLVDLLGSQPKINLEELSVDTRQGKIALSMNLAGTEKTAGFAQQLLDNPPTTLVEESLMSLAALESIAASASVSLSDDLLDWGCDYLPRNYVEETGGKPAEALFYTGMCRVMADNGDFLSLSCLQFADNQQQTLCLDNMEQAKKNWRESKTLEVALKNGVLMLNGVELTSPTLL